MAECNEGQYANGGNAICSGGKWIVPPSVDLGFGLGVAPPSGAAAVAAAGNASAYNPALYVPSASGSGVAPPAAAGGSSVTQVRLPSGPLKVSIDGTERVVTDRGSNSPEGWRAVTVDGYGGAYVDQGGTVRSGSGAQLGTLQQGTPTKKATPGSDEIPPDTKTQPGRIALPDLSSFDPITWAKDNPILAGLGGVVVVGLAVSGKGRGRRF